MDTIELAMPSPPPAEAVRYTQPADPDNPDAPRMGIVKIGDVEWSTVIPPESGEVRPAYDAFIEAGGVPEEYASPPPPGPAARQAVVAAMAELAINGDDITGVETAVNVMAAMALEPHIFWIFFSAEQPDTAYLPFVQSPGFDADVTDRQTSYFEVQVTQRGTGEPAVPASLTLSVQRVQ